MYFYDADKNIVEFIARKNLNNASTLPFNSTQLMSISEIGIPTLNIEEKFQQLRAISSVEEFSGDFNRMLLLETTIDYSSASTKPSKIGSQREILLTHLISNCVSRTRAKSVTFALKMTKLSLGIETFFRAFPRRS